MYGRRTMSFFALLNALILHLRRIQLKLHILTRLIESFPALYGLWSGSEVKLSIPVGAHA